MSTLTQLSPASAPVRNRSRRIVYASLAIVSAVYAGLRLFSGFSFYDDEGSLILMSRWLLDGHFVYRDFNSIYGPFYFLYAWTVHTLLGGSVSNTTVRLVAVVPWVLTCVLAFGYTLRRTGSRTAALLLWLAVLRALAFLAAEPGHPQEICVVLLVGGVAAAARPVSWRMAVCGALVAALLLTKINLGVFAGAGVLLAAASALPAGRGRNLTLAATGAICAMAPAMLMRPLLGAAWVQGCCALLTLSILPVIAMLAVGSSEVTLVWRHWRAMGLGFVIFVSLVLAWAVGRGASLDAMLHSAVLYNLEQSHTWTVPLPLGNAGAVAGAITGAAGAILAILWLAGLRGRAFEWIRLAVGASALLLVMANRPEAAFTISLPFVWMLLVPGPSSGSYSWSRSVLAIVTVMQAMNVYPVAASQLRFTMVLIAISSAIMAHDAWRTLVRDAIWSNRSIHRAGLAALFLAFAGYAFSAGSALTTYLRLSPLDLRGTAGVHIEEGDRITYRWIVSRAQGSCDSLVSFPAMHSLYFWTGMLPPVYPDVDGWQAYANTGRQAVERQILASPRACVLLVDKLMQFWIPGQTADATLLGYIRENFVEVDRHKGFHFLTRKH